jgi:hypothetical protein
MTIWALEFQGRVCSIVLMLVLMHTAHAIGEPMLRAVVVPIAVAASIAVVRGIVHGRIFLW